MSTAALSAHRALEELLEQIVGSPVALTELKRKPGRRRTLRAAGPRRSAIVKMYGSARAPAVAARLAALAGGPAEPRVPEVLLVEPDLRLVVLSDLPGRPLREAALAGDGEVCARAGAVLAAWHRAWGGKTPAAMERQTARRELDILAERAEGASRQIARAVRLLADGLSAEWDCPTVVHRDLYEEQILVGERIALIDLDDAALGPAELDVGNLIAHLELLAMRSGCELSPMVEGLVGGYRGVCADLDPDLLNRCRALTLLRLACIHGEPALLERASAPTR
jgi:Ser/Thr protein kinase RdoA (MazF antagonist)